MDIHVWLQQYGYLALTLGSFAEGDTFLLAGAFLAHHGQFLLVNVFLIGVFTAIVHGQLCFYLGGRFGQPLLDRLPALQSRSARVLALLRRHQRLLIISYRIIFGLRTVTPILIGISGVSARRFMVYNTLGALLWSLCYTLLGYLLGRAAQMLFGQLKHEAVWIVLGVTAALLALSIARRATRR